MNPFYLLPYVVKRQACRAQKLLGGSWLICFFWRLGPPHQQHNKHCKRFHESMFNHNSNTQQTQATKHQTKVSKGFKKNQQKTACYMIYIFRQPSSIFPPFTHLWKHIPRIPPRNSAAFPWTLPPNLVGRHGDIPGGPRLPKLFRNCGDTADMKGWLDDFRGTKACMKQYLWWGTGQVYVGWLPSKLDYRNVISLKNVWLCLTHQ